MLMGLHARTDFFQVFSQYFYWFKIRTLPCPFQNIIFLLRCLAGLSSQTPWHSPAEVEGKSVLGKTLMRFLLHIKQKVLFWTHLPTNHSSNSLLAHLHGFQQTLDWQQCSSWRSVVWALSILPSTLMMQERPVLWPPGIIYCCWTDFIRLYTPWIRGHQILSYNGFLKMCQTFRDLQTSGSD